jgi:hypothetical protein
MHNLVRLDQEGEGNNGKKKKIEREREREREKKVEPLAHNDIYTRGLPFSKNS